MKLWYKAAVLIKATLLEWKKLRPELLGAAISFYAIFSLGSILVIVTGVVGLLLGKQTAEDHIIQEIHRSFGPKPAEVMQVMIAHVSTHSGRLLTTLLSIPSVLFGSAMLFYQLKNTLNHIWNENKSSLGNLGKTAWHYTISFLMVIMLGFLFILLIVKSFVLVVLSEFLYTYIPFPVYLLSIFDVVFTFFALTILFALTYKILLDTPIGWRNVWIGASVTSFLFIISQFVIGLYIRVTEIDSAYGALGSITILLIWIFYSALIYLLGAAFTKVYSQKLWKQTVYH